MENYPGAEANSQFSNPNSQFFEASLRQMRIIILVFTSVICHRTAFRLYGIIKIKPLRGFLMANEDNHIEYI
jgi:predicted transcriptional regulator of viral defense system